ncbi:MAG: ankyrin repeat domain-containing protein [Alphaproteobacteria bacterium]|nr:ankyrin repeat domain-containing protein [Alphaproteobacteria bacterium]
MIHIILLICLAFSAGAFSMEPASKGLDISQRPEDLKRTIQWAFDEHSSSSGKNYLYQGEATSTSIMSIDPAHFFHTLIKTAPKEQKDFYFLDIGAGTFGLSKGTVDYLNQQKDIPDDVTIHIVGVTGENYGDPEIKQIGRCKLYNISAFKIEDLKESFMSLGFDFTGKFDLIVAEFAFIHFHDAVGTFIQAYDLLRPKTGHTLMHGIPVFFEGQIDNQELVWNLIDFLTMTKAPFLIGPGHGDRWIQSFLLRKPDVRPLTLPLSYGSGAFPPRIVHTKEKSYANFIVGDEYIRTFDPDRIAYRTLAFATASEFYGDRELYEWLYTHYDDWHRMNTKWIPMMKDDQREPIEHKNAVRYTAPPKPAPDPLFAIAKQHGTLEQFKAAVHQDNVNSKDEGTPLIMLLDDEKTDWLLLESGLDVDVNATDRNKKTVLFGWHKNSDMMERREPLLNTYLKKGADVNHRDRDGNTPLHDAVQLRSSDVVAWLLTHGADSALQNKKGYTAFDLPQARRDYDVEHVIESYNEGKVSSP